ncbi:hypothetical protein [Thomasclavelia spiroformis]|uniref:hypothetical protein n=1 Tax=Thomasclavelia spiroformis TaxID=29348 RepID=UPI00265E6680|nr:hypothetical protein [Thomasclavelia spiroformis]
MNILDFTFDNWYTLVLKLNWLAVIIIIVLVFAMVSLWDKCIKYTVKKSLMVDEVSLGIGNSQVKLKYNKKDQEIAYKLWVELSTRKIGLDFDPENDVVFEVYDSWYNFFTVARELMKEIPVERLKYSPELIELIETVLNKGLRPHLTIWQAKYRKWYNENVHNNVGKTPQQIQEMYPHYKELKKDLIDTNKRLIEYKKLMERIAFEK